MKKPEISKSNVEMGVNVEIEAKVKELLDAKQYEDVILLMDQTLEKEQNSAYYFYRAYARNKISRNWDKNFKIILDDLNQAIAIDNDEDSLYLRFEVLHQYLQNQHNLLYSMEDGRHNIKSINNDGDIEYYSETENLKWTDKEAREIEKYDALMDESIDMLLELYPKAWYYCMKSDWYTRDRLKNIEKACELDPQPWYFKRKADIEIEEGLYERALNSVVRAKERNQGKIDSDLTYKHARLLIILDDYDTAESIIKELVPIKDEKGLYPDRPVLLTKGQTWIQGYYGIELLYLAGKIDEYARLLSDYYKENPDWVPLELIQRLFEYDNYQLFLEYFNYNDHKNQSILFMNVCALLAVKEVNTAIELIKDLNGELLYQECIDINLTPISQEEDVRKSRALRFEQPSYGAYDDIDVLFSLIRFDRLGVNICIEMVKALFFKTDYLDLHEVYQFSLNNFNKDNQSIDNELRRDELRDEQNVVIWRMKKMQAFLHELPYLRSKDPAKILLLQNRFELALSKFIIMESDKIENNAKEAERIRIISNLSHSIKNLVRSVINPLHNLRQELPEKINTIDLALRAANLIREMVNAINASQSINIQNFIWDAQHPDGESLTLKEIVHACLVYSIGNMFDFKYFNVFSANYFPRSLGISERGLVQMQWEQVSVSGNLDQVLEFAKQHLFKCSVDLDSIADLRIGNAKSSMVNLTILFQEIIFNAIKFSSFVPLDQRFVSIKLTQKHDQIRLDVSNSCDPETIARSTGQGMGIIKDFAKGLNCIPVINRTDTTYSITLEFNNIWRNDVQDSIH